MIKKVFADKLYSNFKERLIILIIPKINIVKGRVRFKKILLLINLCDSPIQGVLKMSFQTVNWQVRSSARKQPQDELADN